MTTLQSWWLRRPTGWTGCRQKDDVSAASSPSPGPAVILERTRLDDFTHTGPQVESTPPRLPFQGLSGCWQRAKFRVKDSDHLTPHSVLTGASGCLEYWATLSQCRAGAGEGQSLLDTSQWPLQIQALLPTAVVLITYSWSVCPSVLPFHCFLIPACHSQGPICMLLQSQKVLSEMQLRPMFHVSLLGTENDSYSYISNIGIIKLVLVCIMHMYISICKWG